MSKKLITTCLALVALAAFALPATASAVNDPDLTCSKAGPLCTVGTKLTAHNVGLMKMTSENTAVLWECSAWLWTGELKENTGNSVKTEITTVDVWGTGAKPANEPEPECTSSSGNFTLTFKTPMCLTANNTMTTDEFQLRGGTCALPEALTFTTISTAIGECKYSRANAASGTYTTEATGDAILSMSHLEFPKESGGLFCPTKQFLDLSLTLEKDVDAGGTKTTNTTTSALYFS